MARQAVDPACSPFRFRIVFFVRKLLLVPLRLCVGYGMSPRLLSLIAAVMLVLLRVSIGWHFYSEGVDKREAGNWSAAPFFANAKGPLANQYREMVWDFEGKFRLSKKANMRAWAIFRDQAIAHYGFDKSQASRAQATYGEAVEQYEWVISENATDIEEFKLGRSRMEMLDTDETVKARRDGVDSLAGQRETIRREWTQKGATALSQIDKIWANYEVAMNAIATVEQADDHGPIKLRKPKTARIDTSIIDGALPYFDIAIGLCLLLGLFTPVAALAAGVFLGSVFLSQYPPSTGPTSSNYQLIESMGCFVLAATGAGRFAGLDFFLHLIVRQFGEKPDPDEE